MTHTVTVNAAGFAEALKDAALYVSKDRWNDALSSVILSIVPRAHKLAIVACDSKALYERQIKLLRGKGIPKPTLPGPKGKVCIDVREVSRLTKLINSRTGGWLTLEIDAQDKNDQHKARLLLADGSATTFTVATRSDIPDFSPIINRAKAGLVKPPKLSNVFIPVAEMTRAGKVFPSKNGTTARICASKQEDHGGCLALLEYQDRENDLDIRVIFMLTEAETRSDASSNAQVKAA